MKNPDDQPNPDFFSDLLNLLTGVGVTRSLSDAVFWLTLAKDRLVDAKDVEAAQRNIQSALAALTPAESKAIQNEVFSWKPADSRMFPHASDLRVWSGKHPLSLIDGYTLLDVEEFSIRLKMALGEKAAAAVSVMAGPGIAAERNGWLIASSCQAHECDSAHWSVAVDLMTYAILTCVRYQPDSDWKSQKVVFGGTNYQRAEVTVSFSEKDRCDIDTFGVAGMKAILAGQGPSGHTPQSNVSSIPPAPALPPKTEDGTIGTGYVIDALGSVVTNYHVAGDCRTLMLRRGEQFAPAQLVAADARNDLVVVRGNLPGAAAVRFRDGKGIRPADEVVAIGFPYAGLLATTPQVTTGTITALAGIGDDSRMLQITAPIQPGNSGGPLFDLSGNVVGTVVSTLDPLIVAKVTGSIPQNVNFAIKVSALLEFLDSKGVAYLTANSTTKMDPADVGEAGAKSVVMVECKR